MVTFELIHKKRRPIKRYAILGFFTTILIFGSILYNEDRPIIIQYKNILLGLNFGLMGIFFFILTFSYKIKNVIGFVSFDTDFIEIKQLDKTERIDIDNISKLRIDLSGYESQNRTSIGNLELSYHSGLENYLHITVNEKKRTFEFYLSNKADWININKISTFFYNRIDLKGMEMPKANPQ